MESVLFQENERTDARGWFAVLSNIDEGGKNMQWYNDEQVKARVQRVDDEVRRANGYRIARKGLKRVIDVTSTVDLDRVGRVGFGEILWLRETIIAMIDRLDCAAAER